MKTLSKRIFFCLTLALGFHSTLTAQECIPEMAPHPSVSVPVESKNGEYLPASGVIRILIVLAEINYDVGTDPYSPWWSATWQPGQSPTWMNSFIDVNTPGSSNMTADKRNVTGELRAKTHSADKKLCSNLGI